ncbi:hypothetical protein GOV12_02130 [Candidatus Pacearchaeota archaeon]|nr:hypothetical protein [Candidatus Pacearchaeota archaeon]
MAGEDLIIKEVIKNPNPFLDSVRPFLELISNHWSVFILILGLIGICMIVLRNKNRSLNSHKKSRNYLKSHA